jgi:hypothetical protein
VVGALAGVLAPRPRQPAVEREADGVEQRCLARARVAVQEEQPGGTERVEVDLLARAEGLERLDLEAVQPH